MVKAGTFQRRKHERYEVELDAAIVGTNLQSQGDFPCKVVNLSRYGLCFEASEVVVEEGSPGRLRVVLPNAIHTTIQFSLIRQSPSQQSHVRYAAELAFTQEGERRKLHSFLSTLRDKGDADGRRKRVRRQKPENRESERRAQDRRRDFGIFSDCVSFASRVPGWKAVYTYFRRTETLQPARIMIGGRHLIWYGSKDYLGLSHDPRVKAAAIKALKRYGTKAGYRAVNGTLGLHEELEQELADFRGSEAALVFPGGYLANIAILTGLLKRDDVAFVDEKAHASILDGCLFSGAKIMLFRHNSAEDLRRKIRRMKSERSLIIVDGVYSVDGDLACLTEIKKVADAEHVPLMVDDAHGFGVLGPRGRGTPAHFGLEGKVDLDMGTLSGVLGGIGGFVTCKRYIKEYLQHLSRGYLFTVSIPPATTAGLLEALRILKSDATPLSKLWANIKQMRIGLNDLDWPTLPTESAIITTCIGNEQKTYNVVRMLEARGVCVSSFVRPAVKRGEARIRLAVTAAHSEDDIAATLRAFEEIRSVFKETRGLNGHEL